MRSTPRSVEGEVRKQVAATTLEELQVLITAETKGLRKELDGVKTQLDGTSKAVAKSTAGIGATLKKLGVALAGAFAVRQIVRFGAAALRSASEVEGAMLGLQSILEGQGRSFGRANGFIQEYISDGLVPLTDAVTAYKNLAARGYNDEQIQSVMGRLKDAAAFGRQSSLSLGEAVKSASEGLKNENSVLVDNAGVTKNVAKMWDEYARSIGKSANQLTQQEKIQAEVNGIIQETRFQVGDAAKYADTYAGRLARLSKTLQDVKRNIGQAFMPIANAVLPLLQAMASGLARVTGFIAQFMQALFGSGKAAANSSQEVAQAQLGVADAVTEAGEAAKGSVTGFDEINQLADKSDSGAPTASAGVPGLPEIEADPDGGAVGGALTSISEKAQKMAQGVRSAFTSVRDSIVSNKDVIVPVLGAIAGALASLGVYQSVVGVVNFVKRLAELNLASRVQGLWSVLAKHPVLLVVTAIGALIGALVTAYRTNEEFRSAMDNLVARLKTALAPAIELVRDVLIGVWNGVFVPFGEFLVWLWKMAIVPVAVVLTDVLGVALGVVGSAASSLWNNVLVPLGDFLIGVLGAAIRGVVDILVYLWHDTLVPVGLFLSDVFQPIIRDFSAVFMFLWKNVLLPLIEFLAGEFTVLFSGTFDLIGGIIGGAKKVFIGLIDFITGVFTGDWRRAWEGVRNVFKGVFDTLWAIVKYPLNLIIGGINLLISGLNKISFTVPDWVPLIGGKTWGISIPQIPQLARGGIIDHPTLAMIGERGREAVVPLENTGFVTSLANAVASAVGTALLQVQQLGAGGGRGTLEGLELAIYMDTVKVAQATIPAIDRERSRTGLKTVIRPI